MLAVLCLAVLATRVTALHPEQLEQQRLHLESARIQEEIHRLHQAIQVSEGAAREGHRKKQQELHESLRGIQLRQQELQVALQERLNSFDPSLPPQNSLHNEPVPGLLSVEEEEVELPAITSQSLREAAELSQNVKTERMQFINLLQEAGVVQEKGSPVDLHTKFFFPTTKEALDRGEQGRTVVDASSALASRHKLTPKQATLGLPKFSLLNTSLEDTCVRRETCKFSKYRSMDGSCNNLKNSHWGQAGTAFQRVLPPRYRDGVNAPRTKSVTGAELPSPRLISTIALSGPPKESIRFTDMLSQFGQFLDHDLTQTPVSRGKDGAGLICCAGGEPINSRLAHPDCLPILLPSNDKVFAPLGQKCMEFVRSLPAPRQDCHFGAREQMNLVSQLIDASNVYGSSKNVLDSLRKHEKGLMNTQKAMGGNPLLPPSNACADPNGNLCFQAGDGRVNVQPGLTALHTIFLREHNRIAKELGKLNPHWSDELLFQESRRVVIAEMQHIALFEWATAILGSEVCKKFDLLPSLRGFRETYHPDINPGITNVFSTACFRFGHCLIKDNIQTHTKFGTLKFSEELKNTHFGAVNQIFYHKEGLDDLIRATCNNRANKFDTSFTSQLQDHLFQGRARSGLDLMSLNIQRGRDHGLPPYVDWRKVCGLPPINSWKDMSDDSFDQEGVKRLQKVYESVKDIDLFAGMLNEKPVHGGIVGKTAGCVILDQFVRLVKGDRFWYERPNTPSSFTLDQINMIKKVRMARILCDNSNGEIDFIQPWVFAVTSPQNQRVSCSDEKNIPVLSFKPWQNMKI